ncbi:hypothetical protein [Bacillus wiedmannii]|uniref:hypothetical protein n=1 Tax=Bacillus wiedmannii TaxID=1890302 RepID=UPI0025A079EB|nr:hypothetical protein [Bacillus wiedmannii]MDM5264842.1 hypothetical protein [Bacillus wiedmannii]
MNITQIKIELERTVWLSPSKSRDIDILISLYEKSELQPKHVIAIENKIRKQAADSNQLTEEFLGLQKLLTDDIKIYMVFLTPDTDYDLLHLEYDNLNDTTLDVHHKVWMHWANNGMDSALDLKEYFEIDSILSEYKKDNTSLTQEKITTLLESMKRTFASEFLGSSPYQPSIVDIFQEILLKEQKGDVPPVLEYVRHTIKAFIQFIHQNIREMIDLKISESTYSQMLYDIRVDGKTYHLVFQEEFYILDGDSFEKIKDSRQTRNILTKINQNEQLMIKENYDSGPPITIPQFGSTVLKKIVGSENGVYNYEMIKAKKK